MDKVIFLEQNRFLFVRINIFSSEYNICACESSTACLRNEAQKKRNDQNMLFAKARYFVPVCDLTLI